MYRFAYCIIYIYIFYKKKKKKKKKRNRNDWCRSNIRSPFMVILLFNERVVIYSSDIFINNLTSICRYVLRHSHQDHQDSLLVNDNHSPGPVIRELVPSSHQRSELSNAILCIFSRWDQRIGEGIPIPDSLGEEATFINICISNGSLKCHAEVFCPRTGTFSEYWNERKQAKLTCFSFCLSMSLKRVVENWLKF